MGTYAGTKAAAGIGAVLAINTGTGTPTWTSIGELTDISLGSRQVASDDATSFQSLAQEWIPTLISSGVWNCKGSLTSDLGQQALEAALNALPPQLKQFQLTLPKNQSQTTTPDVYSWVGLVESFDLTLNPKKITQFNCSIKVSGAISVVYGS